MKVVDLYSLAEDQQIGVFAFDLGDIAALSLQHEDDSCDIALNMDVVETSAQELSLLSHELGHCVTGSFYNRYSPYDVWQRHENRADRWAIQNVLPFDDMLAAMRSGHTTLWDLAEYFGVTENMIRKAYDYYTGPCGLRFE